MVVKSVKKMPSAYYKRHDSVIHGTAQQVRYFVQVFTV